MQLLSSFHFCLTDVFFCRWHLLPSLDLFLSSRLCFWLFFFFLRAYFYAFFLLAL